MEKAVVKDHRVSLHTNLEIILYLGAGVFVSIVPLRFQYLFLFPLLTYGYLHNRKAILFFLFSLSLFFVALSVSTAYLSILGIIIFFLLVQCAGAVRGSLPLWMSVITLAVQLPFVIQLQDWKLIVMTMSLLALLYGAQLENGGWMRNEWQHNDIWKGTFLVTACFTGIYYFPDLTDVFSLTAGMLVMMVCQPLAGCMLLLLMNIHIYDFPLTACLAVVLLHAPIDKRISSLLFLLIMWMLQPTLVQTVTAGMAYVIKLMQWQHELKRNPVVSMDLQQEKEQIMKRRLQNYSGVFYSLGQFYEAQHQQDSNLLYQMADGVAQMALQLGAKTKTMDEKALKEVLEGYQFTVHSLKVVQQDAQIRIEGVIDRTARAEIDETLKPLLDTLYATCFHLEYLKESRLFYRSSDFVFSSSQHYWVDASYDSISVRASGNGDTCSIFRHGPYTICSLSDGMGSGEAAAKSSLLISGIFQRMIASDMDAVQAVKTVNRLMHSDIYATLDVICINVHTRKAYLIKSAACPTLLIRKKRLLRLDGRSLPVGILEEIEPHCMEVQLQKDDEILMVSDGVRMQEIEHWLRMRRSASVRDELNELMRGLRLHEREDDTTALLLRFAETEYKHEA